MKLLREVYSFPATFELGDDGEYGVYFHDIPGMTSGGTDLEKAKKNVVEGLAAHLCLMIETGYEIPEASRIEDVPLDDGETVFPVTVTLDDIREAFIEAHRVSPEVRSSAVQFPLPDRKIAEIAQKLGVPFSDLCDLSGASVCFAQACSEVLTAAK